jgi:Cu(I)/Ag(I) efflux system periplasmic protein CusF
MKALAAAAVFALASTLAHTGEMKGMDMPKGEMKGMDMSRGEMKGMDMSKGDMKGMDMSKGGMKGTHKATGTVKSVDAKAGTVTLDHAPVASMNWPAMTMSFQVKDKALMDKLGQGKKVEVEFEQRGKDYVITSAK